MREQTIWLWGKSSKAEGARPRPWSSVCVVLEEQRGGWCHGSRAEAGAVGEDREESEVHLCTSHWALEGLSVTLYEMETHWRIPLEALLRWARWKYRHYLGSLIIILEKDDGGLEKEMVSNIQILFFFKCRANSITDSLAVAHEEIGVKHSSRYFDLSHCNKWNHYLPKE